MYILPARTWNPLGTYSLLLDLSPDIAVGTRIIPVSRLQRAGVNDPVLHQRLRLVYMTQSDIIKSAFFQSGPVHRNMLLISPVGQQDLIHLLPLCKETVTQRFPQFSAVIAESVYRRPELRELHIFRISPKQRDHIPIPAERAVIGIAPDIIVIPRDEHHFRMAQF